MSLLLATAIGLAAGVVGGLFGVGGGIVIVPGLMLAAGFGEYRAVSTSTAVIVAVSAAAVVPFATEGYVRADLAAWLFAGSSVGAVLGARALHRVPEARLRTIFAIFLVAASIRMFVTA